MILHRYARTFALPPSLECRKKFGLRDGGVTLARSFVVRCSGR